jgi:hypothetical protein
LRIFVVGWNSDRYPANFRRFIVKAIHAILNELLMVSVANSSRIYATPKISKQTISEIAQQCGFGGKAHLTTQWEQSHRCYTQGLPRSTIKYRFINFLE